MQQEGLSTRPRLTPVSEKKGRVEGMKKISLCRMLDDTRSLSVGDCAVPCIRVDRCNAISCGVGQSGAADTGWRVAFPCQLTIPPYSMDRGRRAGVRASQLGQ